jgi:Flp pilus assembly pilin Flp
MRELNNILWRLRIARDHRGQDLVEYALLAGMLVVAGTAVFPGVQLTLRGLFSRVLAALQGKLGEQG